MCIESGMPSNHLVLCHPLLLHSIFPSIRVFSNESVLRIRWPKYWSFSLSISPSSEYSELISFRIDWFDLLAAQEALKSLLQHHSSKASILQCSAFFIVQLSHPYMTTGEMIALTRRNFVTYIWKRQKLFQIQFWDETTYGKLLPKRKMWELDYKESWALKNWCFWIVVLEKTLESPWTARRSNQ